MIPQEDNVIDVKKVGYLQYVDVPNKKDFDSYVKGYKKTQGKSKTQILNLYDINQQFVEEVKAEKENYQVPIFFNALLNSEYLPLISTFGKKYKENTKFVRAQDILYQIDLAQEFNYGEDVRGNPKTMPYKGYALIPGTKVDTIEENEIKRESLLEFEKKLGLALYQNTKVKNLSDKVKDKCIEIIKDLNKKEGSKIVDIKGLSKDINTNISNEKGNPSIAGATELKPDTVEGIIKNLGNVRETMTIFMNLARAKDVLLKEKEVNKTNLDPIVKENIAATGKGRLVPNSGIKSKDVKNQKVNRGKTENNPFLQEKSNQKIDDPNLALTDREKELQESGAQSDGLLKWAEGQNVWRLNEEADFVKTARDLSFPLKAGPSGTTDRLFQLRKIFNIDITPRDFVALVIAYILPINAHSLVEVMTAARPYIGIGGDSDMKKFYGELFYYSPIVQGAMFSILKDGKYPHITKLLGIVEAPSK